VEILLPQEPVATILRVSILPCSSSSKGATELVDSAGAALVVADSAVVDSETKVALIVAAKVVNLTKATKETEPIKAIAITKATEPTEAVDDNGSGRATFAKRADYTRSAHSIPFHLWCHRDFG
jgi:hypothetical protein